MMRGFVSWWTWEHPVQTAGWAAKYLILPPDHGGDVPDGYFVAQSTSYVNLICLRGFVVNGSTEPASQMFRHGIKIYPLDRTDNPPAMDFLNGSGQVFNTIHPTPSNSTKSCTVSSTASRLKSSVRKPGVCSQALVSARASVSNPIATCARS